jgi:hypothetical protein
MFQAERRCQNMHFSMFHRGQVRAIRAQILFQRHATHKSSIEFSGRIDRWNFFNVTDILIAEGRAAAYWRWVRY